MHETKDRVSPNKYDLPAFDKTRERARAAVIVNESEKQKEMAVKKWARTDKPNPFSYRTEKGEQLVSTKKRLLSFSFSKDKRKTFQGKWIEVICRSCG